MRRPLRWVGFLLCGVGLAALVASAVMSYMGMNPSYNFGDPTKFEFVLVPFWQIGLIVVTLGAVCLLASRWMKSAA
jgi:hypothetical protein